MDDFGILPNEMLSHVLSFFSFEEIDNLRLVNQRFKSVCNYLLKKNYRNLKQQVALCNEKTRLLLISDQLSSKFRFGVSHRNYTSRIFWFVVNEFLGNNFCLFDSLKGYLDKKYFVNGKTLDVVRQILWLKETDDPIPLLAEMIIGRSRWHSNMKCFEDFGVAYCKWFFVKHFRNELIEEIYEPILNNKQPGLNLPKLIGETKRWSHAMVLDMFTCLWTGELNIKKNRVLPATSCWALADEDVLKVIPVLKFGQNEDPQLYEGYDFTYEEFLALINDDDDYDEPDDGHKSNHQLDLAFQNLRIEE